ncbi:glutathione S-transferase family protein [Dyella caseinilytica]|uniref:Glutathione S-transferase family protein n=1 Tax=Dyella caseinilytica TaxID=1849581 RepID=A0ABX7GWM3_9GAMM|nr:glutathione S-transferase family protein [Dyella caseinilytica]QRN54812.1 glutathione S-transferase family protein [Dyella caseinilytica]GFZ97038.1 glutathione S-transferase [Dyella caseinilytica]
MSLSSITLYVTRPGFLMPETSPFVIKTEVQLQMAGLPYQRESTIPPLAPKGKVPYIVDDGEVVPDSTFIRAHIERKYGADLDEGLDARQRAESWAIERLLEDHLYFAMVWFRWIVPENFAKGPAHFADRAPEEEREQLRRDMQARRDADLRSHGIGRHTAVEIASLGERSINTVAQLLGERSYLMGERLTGVDAFAFGVLASILTPFFDTPLRRILVERPNLVAYVQRMMQRFYPDHVWEPLKEPETV